MEPMYVCMVWCITNLVRYFFNVSLSSFYITIQTYNTQIIDDYKMAWNNFKTMFNNSIFSKFFMVAWTILLFIFYWVA